MKPRDALVLLLCIVLSAVAADEAPTVQAPEAKPRLAVIPLEAEGVSENDAAIATQYLTTELIRRGRFEVLEREYIADIMEEQALALVCNDVECAVEIGRVLAAENVLVGSVRRSGSDYVVNVRLIDVEQGRIVGSTTEECSAQTSYLSSRAGEIGSRVYPDRIEAENDNGWLWWTLGGVAAVGAGTAVYLLAGDDAGEHDPLPDWPDHP